MLQQAVGGQTQALVTLLPVAQGVLPPLRADRGKRLLQVKSVNMVVDVDQLSVFSLAIPSSMSQFNE